MIEARVIGEAAAIRSVPARIVLITAAAAFAGGIVAFVEGWPLWAVGVCVVAPTLPLLVCETRWLCLHYGWFSLFWVLVVTQIGHFVEHIAQMSQIHLQGESPKVAHGIFGQLDIEWVHFIWNSWVARGGLAPGDPVLAQSVALGDRGHRHLARDRARCDLPGLPADGEAGRPRHAGEGWAYRRRLADSSSRLHFFYNLIETLPLVIAFIWQAKHIYGEAQRSEMLVHAPAAPT